MNDRDNESDNTITHTGLLAFLVVKKTARKEKSSSYSWIRFTITSLVFWNKNPWKQVSIRLWAFDRLCTKIFHACLFLSCIPPPVKRPSDVQPRPGNTERYNALKTEVQAYCCYSKKKYIYRERELTSVPNTHSVGWFHLLPARRSFFLMNLFLSGPANGIRCGETEQPGDK